MRQSRIGFVGRKEWKCLQTAEKQLFDQPVVSELPSHWNFIFHLFFCQYEELLKIKSLLIVRKHYAENTISLQDLVLKRSIR